MCGTDCAHALNATDLQHARACWPSDADRQTNLLLRLRKEGPQVEGPASSGKRQMMALRNTRNTFGSGRRMGSQRLTQPPLPAPRMQSTRLCMRTPCRGGHHRLSAGCHSPCPPGAGALVSHVRGQLALRHHAGDGRHAHLPLLHLLHHAALHLLRKQLRVVLHSTPTARRVTPITLHCPALAAPTRPRPASPPPNSYPNQTAVRLTGHACACVRDWCSQRYQEPARMPLSL